MSIRSMAGRWVLCYLILVLHCASMIANAASVPAIFVLGDSTVDVGTNNHLETYAKANFLYNGIDFPGGSNPTGRFSNGLNTRRQKFGFSVGLVTFKHPSSKKSVAAP